MSHRRLFLYLVFFSLAVLVTMLMHEGGHFLAGTILGNPMEMNLNNTRPVHGYYFETWHSPLVAAAGSLFSIAQAFVFWFLLRRKKTVFLYPFLFYPAFYRVLPYLITLGHQEQMYLQDKGQVGAYLGISPWFLIGPYLLLICSLVFAGSRRLKVKWQLNLLSLIFSFLLTLFWLQVNHVFL